jgi:hypothetical protein
VQSENLELLDRVMQQRRDLGTLINHLESAVADIENGAAALHSDDADLDGLRNVNRAADEQMRTM